MRYPTDKQINACQWLKLTADSEWDPYSPNINDYEEKEIRNHHTVTVSHSVPINTIETYEQTC